MAGVLALSAFGYVEEKFFLSGTDRAYTADGSFGNDGIWPAKFIQASPRPT